MIDHIQNHSALLVRQSLWLPWAFRKNNGTQ
jgi:hypothetical protein